jgi:uncharacterized protein
MESAIRECCFKTIPENGRRLVWEITHQCTFQCIYCFQQRKRLQNPLRVIHNKDLLEICDKIVNLKIRDVLITGGEIYKVKDELPGICEKLKSIDLKFSFSTNAIANHTFIDQLVSLGPRAINISFDPPNNGINFNNTLITALDHLIKVCYAKQTEIKITSVFNESNIESLEIYRTLLLGILSKENTITSVYITNPYDIGYIKSGININLDKQSNLIKLNGFESYKQIKYVNFPRFNIPLQRCFAGSHIVHIEPNGNVYPCHLFANLPQDIYLMGNILNDNTSDINDRLNIFSSQVNDWLNKALSENTKCISCRQKSKCGGGCIAEILSQGDLVEPQLICRKLPYPKKKEYFVNTVQRIIEFENIKNDLGYSEEREIQEFLLNKLRERNHDLAHGYDHIICVVKLARFIAERENANLRIVTAAAYFHDFEPRQKLIFESHTKISAQVAVDFLLRLGFSQGECNEIFNCIDTSSYGSSQLGKEPKSLEAKIVRDADWLEAIGARGIARVFAFAPSHNCEVLGDLTWDPENPPHKMTSLIGPDPSPIYHFASKLLWIKEGIITETGKKIAELRHKRLITFLKDYKNEMEEATFFE